MPGGGAIHLVASVYVVAFMLLCAGFFYAGLKGAAARIMGAASAAVAAMRDASMDELEKEQTVQRCAVEMVRVAVSLTVKLVVILLVTAFPVWLSATLGWISLEAFWAFAMRADVLLVSTAVVLVPLLASRFLSRPRR